MPYSKKKKKAQINSGIIAVSVILAMIAMIFLFIFVINRWTVTVTLNGDENVVIEDPKSYKEKGAVAKVQGTVLMRDGKDLDVKISGNADKVKVGGKTEIEYTAHYLWIKGKAVRTVVLKDDIPPVIELLEKDGYVTIAGEEYKEEGFKATDNVDGDITDKVKSEVRNGKVFYTVEDSSGNTATAERVIKYKDDTIPKITLSGETEMTIDAGTSFTEPGYKAEDSFEGDLTDRVTVEGSVDPYSAGEYVLKYTVKDSYGNTAQATRKVTVKAKQQPDGGSENTEGRVIYLTFDDGPSQYTPRLLDILKKYNVKATFFVINANQDIIAREFKEGHSVGIHTACHVYDTIYASEDAYFADLNQMQDIIVAKTGQRTTLMRFPGGSSNTISRFNPGIMTRLTKAVTDAGYQYFDWNVSSGDAGETTSTDQVYLNVINGCNGRKNSVVLQHDTKEFSINAVERIINWGLSNGYTFLPLKPNSPGMHHGVNN